jgi:hypothetical protein
MGTVTAMNSALLMNPDVSVLFEGCLPHLRQVDVCAMIFQTRCPRSKIRLPEVVTFLIFSDCGSLHIWIRRCNDS